MTATISFLAGQSQINNLSGSGLGFYGANFGQSVAVGAWQTTTFITSADGTQQGPPCHNTTFLNAASGQVDSQTSGIALTAITNLEATLNIRFNNSTPVQAQNAYVTIYDRTSVSNPATGVHTAMASIQHPDPVQNNNGSGSQVWTIFSGIASATGIQLNLPASPGASGNHANNASTWEDTQHDWYLAISASPDTIGSKTLYGLWTYLEYL